MTPVPLGEKGRDRISGFEGVVTARTEYLYDAPALQLSRGDSTAKPEHVWVKEATVEPVERTGPGF